MHIDARIATAWLVGYSAARLGKPDDADARFKGVDIASELTAAYRRGRSAGEQSVSLAIDLLG
jgi:hypothetical protein